MVGCLYCKIIQWQDGSHRMKDGSHRIKDETSFLIVSNKVRICFDAFRGLFVNLLDHWDNRILTHIVSSVILLESSITISKSPMLVCPFCSMSLGTYHFDNYLLLTLSWHKISKFCSNIFEICNRRAHGKCNKSIVVGLNHHRTIILEKISASSWKHR